MDIMLTEDTVYPILEAANLEGQNVVIIGDDSNGCGISELTPAAAIILKDGAPSEVLLLDYMYFPYTRTPTDKAYGAPGDRFSYAELQQYYGDEPDQIIDYGSYWFIFHVPKYRNALIIIATIILFLIIYYRRKDKAR